MLQAGLVFYGDNLSYLKQMPTNSIDLVYIDPPYNTGKVQKRTYTKTERDDAGDRKGFGGHTYKTTKISSASFDDSFDDFMGFIKPRVEELHRVLKPTGSLYFHINYKEVHYCKVLIDSIFGRECFLNEVIWAWDYGAKAKRKWPAKHDNILVYVKDPEAYYFDDSEVERIPYMAPGLVNPEKQELGKRLTDTWWHTIVSPMGKEKMGYPTQKPMGVISRIVKASCPPGGLVLDAFAGSGTTGAVALQAGRNFIMIDQNPEAIEIMKHRFAEQDVVFEEASNG
jgi:site-specific DNA-methyltransferase (adenine-specific)